jgi:hypothetical protein
LLICKIVPGASESLTIGNKFHFERQFASEVVYAVEFGDGDGGVCGDEAVSFEFGLFAAPSDHAVGGDADNGDFGAVESFLPSQRRRESILGFLFFARLMFGILGSRRVCIPAFAASCLGVGSLGGVLPIRRTTEKEVKLFHTLG